MRDESSIIPAGEQVRGSDILRPDISMTQQIEIATRVADQLKQILKDRKLVVNMRGNDYVTVEGWNTLGTILGTHAVTDVVEPVDFTQAKFAYRAKVTIKQGDNILSSAEAIATSGGNQREEHQVYSMAQTRALGKAYRMAFSWIIKLAGYEPTPYEEMEAPRAKPSNRRGPVSQLAKYDDNIADCIAEMKEKKMSLTRKNLKELLVQKQQDGVLSDEDFQDAMDLVDGGKNSA